MLRIATSTWTLHRKLGRPWYQVDGHGGMVNQRNLEPGEISLLELPAFVAQDGIRMLEICHFHFPAIDGSYLDRLKAALTQAGVELANVLVDSGNLSNPDMDEWRADVAMGKAWQKVAARLGATGVRFDCGLELATEKAMDRSTAALRELADHGDSLGLITLTENWRTTSIQPENLLAIMDKVGRPLGLCVDFGNAARTEDKYATLAALLPRATSIHCKGEFIEGRLDVTEFSRCLDLVRDASFSGYIALIDDSNDDPWSNALRLKEAVEAYFSDVTD